MDNDKARQIQLLSALKSASTRLQSGDSFIYKSEMLGYLPDLIFQWIEIGDTRLDTTMPVGWCRADLEALSQTGQIEKCAEVIGKSEPEDYWAYYRFADE